MKINMITATITATIIIAKIDPTAAATGAVTIIRIYHKNLFLNLMLKRTHKVAAF